MSSAPTPRFPDWRAASDRLADCLAELALPPAGRSEYAKGDVSKRELVRLAGIIEVLSASYLDRGTAKAPAIAGPDAARAYALYYGPLTFAKVGRLMPTIAKDRLSPELSVLDFGSGPGTAALAALAHLPAVPTTVTMVDRSSSMLDAARTLSKAYIPDPAVTWRFEGYLPRGEKHDVVLAANVLNEAPPEEGKRLAMALASMLRPGGSLVLVEPALKDTTRRLQAIRDFLLLSDESLVPRFPCTRRDPCPMLAASPDEWCHGTIGWERPRLLRQLDDMLGFNKHRIKYAGLVLQLGSALVPGYRLVAPPGKVKGKTYALACGPAHYGHLELWKRDRNDRNRIFERANHYDRIVVTPDHAGTRIGPESDVVIATARPTRPPGPGTGE